VPWIQSRPTARLYFSHSTATTWPAIYALPWTLRKLSSQAASSDRIWQYKAPKSTTQLNEKPSTAKIADRLIEERSRGSRKLHEAHLSQIQAYVHSFEELCDLHPEKFARFPLSEQGKLQSIAENQSRLRALITSTFALS
jgi:hypothetical protein